MSDNLPLLVFPNPVVAAPPRGTPRPIGQPHFREHSQQSKFLKKYFAEIGNTFSSYKASVATNMDDFEPETVLVFEVAGEVGDFAQAIGEVTGLDWLGEWDVDDIQPDESLYLPDKVGVDFFKNKIPSIASREQSKQIRDILLKENVIDDNGFIIHRNENAESLPYEIVRFREEIYHALLQADKKPIKGRVFLSLSTERGLTEVQKLWRMWQNNQILPHGQTKWRDVFNQTSSVRLWGITETLIETGMLDYWRDLVSPIAPENHVEFQIELFYPSSKAKRLKNQQQVRFMLSEIEGHVLGDFIDIHDIAFHAVKASIPAINVSTLIEYVDKHGNIPYKLFNFPGVMYFRPVPQGIITNTDSFHTFNDYPTNRSSEPPIAAILDGAPSIHHKALKDRIILDDPDQLSDLYLPGEKMHGTRMASLILNGDLSTVQTKALKSKLHCIPILQPDINARSFQKQEERVPVDVFIEDRIHTAVRRLFENKHASDNSSVKIINLSVCEEDRPFCHYPSPLARLLDYLSYKYRVLFCVSAGNYTDDVSLGVSFQEYKNMSDEERTHLYPKLLSERVSRKKILSPSESINALTIGALHDDRCGEFNLGNRIDVVPDDGFPSTISRVGHGFRGAIKPEIFLPGGKQLYRIPIMNDSLLPIDLSGQKPGHRTATDSGPEGGYSEVLYSAGTSNATALATRAGVRIAEMLNSLSQEKDEVIPDRLIAVLIKTLLVHGATPSEVVGDIFSNSLKKPSNSKKIRKVITRYLGYGNLDLNRVLSCTEQRGTVLGFGEIQSNQIHEYKFPLPECLEGFSQPRSMIVTLAWLSPINPRNRKYRQAKLFVKPVKKWQITPLKLKRVFHDHNQVQKGTIQHEILEGHSEIAAYAQDGFISLQIECKRDATLSLDDSIPYGLAVTLEVAEGIKAPIYQQLKALISTKVSIGINSDTST